jgi:hypothetical protein
MLIPSILHANTPVNGGAARLISSSYKLSSARGVRFYRLSLASVSLDSFWLDLSL